MKKHTLAILLGLTLPVAVSATAVFAQADDEPRTERRIKVVVSDGETVTEERVWVGPDSEGGAIFLPGHEDGEVEHLELAPFLHSRAYLGVQLLDITPELRRHFGAAPDSGVLVAAVAEKSPAASAGIAVGDVLTAIDGVEVARTRQVIHNVGARDEGATISLDLVRDHKSLSLEATLAEGPRSQVDLAPMFWAPGDGERRILRLPRRVIEIESGDLDEAFSELHERLQSPEWREKLKETDSRRRTLENRIQELEEKLREMEKRLEEDSR